MNGKSNSRGKGTLMPPAGLKFEKSKDSNKLQPTYLYELDESDINLLIKNNALVSGMYHLTALENEVVNTALMIAMQQIESGKSISADDIFRISYKSYAKMWDVDLANAQKNLAKCCLTLRQKSFWYLSTENNTSGKKVYESGWFAWVTPHLVDKEYFEFGFPKPLIPLLEGAALNANGSKKQGYFTWLFFSEVQKLKGSFYGQRFYEVLSQFKHIKSEVVLSVEDIRNLLQLGNKYPLTTELKRNVLNPAYKDINARTRLRIEYEDIKRGKNIVAFRFYLKFDREDKNFKKALGKEVTVVEVGDQTELFGALTSLQILKYANLLAKDSEFINTCVSKHLEGKRPTLGSIKQELADPVKLAEYMPYLVKHGYDVNFKENIIG